MRYLRPHIEEADARDRFQKRRLPIFTRLVDALHGKSAPPELLAAPLPKLELVWIPHYLIDFRVQSSNAHETITAIVDGYIGAFALFRLHEGISEEDFPHKPIPPRMSGDDAVVLARKSLLTASMAQRGRRRKLLVQEHLATELVQYPYWIYYFLRRAVIDIAVMDAVIGDFQGPKIKAACLAALETEHRLREESTH